MKMLLTTTHQGEITGELSCYDRVLINATAGTFGYADGMTMFFNQRKYRMFDFEKVFTILRSNWQKYEPLEQWLKSHKNFTR